MQISGTIRKLPNSGFMLKSTQGVGIGEYIIQTDDATEFTNDTVGLLASAEVEIFPVFGRDGYVKRGTLRVTI
jgi:hypothetical protein